MRGASSTFLADSVESLSSSTSGLLGKNVSLSPKKGGNPITKAYKRAQELFLTRRLPEALLAIEPVISALPSADGCDTEHGESQDRDGPDGESSAIGSAPPPVATAQKRVRVKVWSLYLTLLNSVIELGPEDGKALLGVAQWKAILQKCQDGSIWEEVVQSGYGGLEGSVDAELILIVLQRSILLLAHSTSQKMNQQCLEMYFASSSFLTPSQSDSSPQKDSISSVDATASSSLDPSGSSETLRGLNTRLKLIELYALHVLPRNGEWDYAKDFISLNAFLDEERRDYFLQSLDSLQEQKDESISREVGYFDSETTSRHETTSGAFAPNERPKKNTIKTASSGANGLRSNPAPTPKEGSFPVSQKQQQQHERSHSEIDYGIDDMSPRPLDSTHRLVQSKEAPSRGTNDDVRSYRKNLASASTSRTIETGLGHAQDFPAPKSYSQRTFALVGRTIQRLAANLTKFATIDPAGFLRTLFFLTALLFALGRRDVRLRLAAAAAVAWQRIRGTAGMAVKVSYL